MAPFLLFAIAIFSGFLLFLAILGFAAYRVSARREGPAMGAAGGCALTAVLLGAGAFATTAFIVLLGIAFAHMHHRDHADSDGSSESAPTFEMEESPSDSEHSDEPGSDDEHRSDDQDKSDGVRQY